MLQTRLSDTSSLSGKYTTEQLAWLQKARDFARRVPLSEVMDSDSKNVFRRDLFEAACKEGLGSLPFPSTYGGSGGDDAVIGRDEGVCVPGAGGSLGRQVRATIR